MESFIKIGDIEGIWVGWFGMELPIYWPSTCRLLIKKARRSDFPGIAKRTKFP